MLPRFVSDSSRKIWNGNALEETYKPQEPSCHVTDSAANALTIRGFLGAQFRNFLSGNV